MLVALAGCDSDDKASDGKADDSSSTAAGDPTAASESTSADGTTEAAADDICVPLKVIRDYDVEASQAAANGGDWPQLQKELTEGMPVVLDAYDDAIAIDSDVHDDLVVLRDFTAATEDAAKNSSSIEEFASAAMALPNVEQAGRAGLSVSTFSEKECGFSTGNN